MMMMMWYYKCWERERYNTYVLIVIRSSISQSFRILDDSRGSSHHTFLGRQRIMIMMLWWWKSGWVGEDKTTKEGENENAWCHCIGFSIFNVLDQQNPCFGGLYTIFWNWWMYLKTKLWRKIRKFIILVDTHTHRENENERGAWCHCIWFQRAGRKISLSLKPCVLVDCIRFSFLRVSKSTSSTSSILRRERKKKKRERERERMRRGWLWVLYRVFSFYFFNLYKAQCIHHKLNHTNYRTVHRKDPHILISTRVRH